MSHKRRQYTSEVSDGQWKRLEWLFPKRRGRGRPMELSLREVIQRHPVCDGDRLPVAQYAQ